MVQQQQERGLSLNPDTFIEGGGPPINQTLRWTNCRYVVFTYQGKGKPSVGAEITFVTNEGTAEAGTNVQFYSAGPPERYRVSSDGKKLVGMPGVEGISKNSNYGILLAELLAAGFPKDRLTDDISQLDNMLAYHIGKEEPARSGLDKSDEQNKRGPKITSVPSKIMQLPWEAKPAQAPAGMPAGAPAYIPPAQAPAPAPAPAPANTDLAAKAAGILGELLANGPTTRQAFTGALFAQYVNDPDRDKLAGIVYQPDFPALMTAYGITVSGETVSR